MEPMSTFGPTCMSLYYVWTKLSDPDGGWCCFLHSVNLLTHHKNLVIPTLFLKVTVSNESDLGRGLSQQWGQDLYGFSMAPKYQIHLKSKEHPRYLALLHFRLWIAALGPQPNKHPTFNEKPGCPMWQLPKALLVKLCTIPCASQLPPQPKTLKCLIH